MRLPRYRGSRSAAFSLAFERHRAGREYKALLLCFAQQVAGRAVDEMQPAASLTDHGYIGLFFTLFGVRQPMLHIYAGLGKFEYDVAAHAGHYIDDRRTRNIGCLRRFADITHLRTENP
jgi:hypothetical protein